MSDRTSESPNDGTRTVREEDLGRTHSTRHPESDRRRHPETERPHKPRRPETPRPHGPRRPASDLPHTMGQVSLEEILARNPKADRRRAPRSPKAHLFVTVAHWSMTLLLAVNLLSGMRIGWGYQESALGGMQGAWAAILAKLSPAGTMFGINLIILHVWSAFLLVLVAGVYVGYLIRSGSTQRLKLTRADLRKLVDGIRGRRFWRSKPALWSANLLVYWVSFVSIAVLTVTGLALYRLDLGLSPIFGGYDVVRLLHAVVGYLLIPYTILHATLQWFFGRFWTIFKAQVFRPHVMAGLIGLAIAAPVAAGLYLLDDMPTTLTVPRLARGLPAPVVDGNPADMIWAHIPAVTIHTAKATNAPGHVTDVSVKAVHDGTHVYFQFQWIDPDVSYKRYPLVKTEGGWKVLQTAFANADENVYYEDKLSMYVTNVKNGSCATTCHLGVGPSSEKNEKHGLHYTAGETGDVWHWKSVRTDPVGIRTGEPGWADDMYFGPRTPVKPGERYTGGYYADPDKGGAYAYNFVKLDPKKSLADTYVVPKFLPPSGAVHTNPAPATSEHGRTWWIHESHAVPYAKEADTYPVGTLIPNIVIAPLTGDRGDVRAKGEWRDGRWTLETRRVLDTGSKYDVAFVPGEPVYITVATYNRSQTRHSEHIKPVRVVLEP
jgi:thiosulfate reductase cytochrome b subunit